MKQLISFTVFIILNCSIHAGYDVIINDDFSSSDQYIDLSVLLLWNDHTDPVSTWKIFSVTDDDGLTFNAIGRSDTSLIPLDGGCCDSPGFLTANCFDYEFPVIDRTNDTIILEFDLWYEELTGSLESGRTVVTFMHDYPAGGPAFGDIYNVSDQAAFGRPAYNIRVKNVTYQGSNNYGNMMYGGGRDIEGEFESTDNNWLPGFSSTPGGFAPGSHDSTGGDQFPLGPCYTYRDSSLIKKAGVWQHFTYILYPERQELWRRFTKEDAGQDKLVMFMEIPNNNRTEEEIINMMNAAHVDQTDSLPLLYNYFDKVNALRFYNRWSTEFAIANVNIKATKNTTVDTDNQLENKEKEIHLYPNPATDYLMVKSPDMMEQELVTITSINGQKLFSERHTGYTLKIDVATYARGAYIIKVGDQRKLFFVQ